MFIGFLSDSYYIHKTPLGQLCTVLQWKKHLPYCLSTETCKIQILMLDSVRSCTGMFTCCVCACSEKNVHSFIIGAGSSQDWAQSVCSASYCQKCQSYAAVRNFWFIPILINVNTGVYYIVDDLACIVNSCHHEAVIYTARLAKQTAAVDARQQLRDHGRQTTYIRIPMIMSSELIYFCIEWNINP